MKKTAVIGAGAWGTTLSILLAEKGQETMLWVFEKELAQEMIKNRENTRFLPGCQINEKIEITHDLSRIAGAEICFFAVPTQFMRSILRQCADIINHGTLVVSAGKGIEQNTLKLPTEIIQEELKNQNTAVLSGPNLSREIIQGLPAASVVASNDQSKAKIIQEALMLERFRVYTNSDPIGVQLGGALKNVIAIAAGMVDGLSLGNNAKAGILIRGLAEIARLGVAMGAQAKTFSGLSGMGDLITTAFSPLSRNHAVGEQMAKGKKLAEITSRRTDVAEGVPTTQAAAKLAEKHKVSMPITQEIYSILYEGKDPYQAISGLMNRLATSE